MKKRYLAELSANMKIVVLATITALIAGGTPALAHGVEHARLAHNAERVGGLTANQVRSKTVQVGLSRGSMPTDQATTIATADISVPRAGGVLVASGLLNPDFQNDGTLGIIYIQVDGTCAGGTGDAWWDTYSSLAESASTTVAKKVTAGSHKVRLCADSLYDWELFPDTSVPFMGGGLTVTWNPVAGAVGSYSTASAAYKSASGTTAETDRKALLRRALERARADRSK